MISHRAAPLWAAISHRKDLCNTSKTLLFKVLFTVSLIAALIAACSLIGFGLYAAMSGRSAPGSEDKISVLGIFSISSQGGALGLVFSGMALFALCIAFLSRFVPR